MTKNREYYLPGEGKVYFYREGSTHLSPDEQPQKSKSKFPLMRKLGDFRAKIGSTVSNLASRLKLKTKPKESEKAPAVLPDTQVRDAHDSDEQGPNWIEDEGLLRDEGVIFGLASADVESKLDTIKAYYEQKLEAAKKYIADYRQEEERLQQLVNDTKAGLNAKEDKVKSLQAYEPHNGRGIQRPLLALIGYTAAFIINWFLIRFCFQGVWSGTEASFIAAGVYLFGLFSLFHRHSVFFYNSKVVQEKNNNVELWKLLLNELGIPVAVVGIIVAFGYYSRLGNPAVLIATALFTLFLLVYGGKQLLLQWEIIGTLLKQRSVYRKGRKSKRKEAKAILADLKTDREAVATAEQRLEQYREGRLQLPNTSEIEKLCESKISLFKSEYELARKHLPNLSPSDTQSLINSRKQIHDN